MTSALTIIVPVYNEEENLKRVEQELTNYIKIASKKTKVLFVNFGEKEEAYCLPVLAELRKNGINSEIFPDSSKMKKQMNYANKRKVPFVVLVGEQEMNSNTYTLKNMVSGIQEALNLKDLINHIK